MNESPVDFSYLEQLGNLKRKDGPDLLTTVLMIFMNQTPDTMKNIQASIHLRNFQEASRLAHKLKSTAGNIGARKLTNLLNQLELQSPTEPLEKWNILFQDVESEYRLVQSFVQEKLNIQEPCSRT